MNYYQAYSMYSSGTLFSAHVLSIFMTTATLVACRRQTGRHAGEIGSRCQESHGDEVALRISCHQPHEFRSHISSTAFGEPLMKSVKVGHDYEAYRNG